ncbi:hypothetical protein GNX18_04360 [Microbulbifer sp. SH-1]|uniref:hypothetical protein n=1 Tax=Microbulbifer sp. SH-1 TaxID=2681547 RepID=UPI00140F0396|nr:hypothetical protein [Microbulbifer sp. SH-1]QIL89080.1 hypothetical protein GNX18_04360 [Microbulbifer sp. SH-1]
MCQKEINIYQAPKSEISTSMTTYPLEAHKRFKWVMLAFLANAIFAALTIFSKDILPITATYYLALFWTATTIIYAFMCGMFFWLFGKTKCLWGIAILVTQPVGIIGSFGWLLYRGIKNGWYKNA